MWNLSPTIGVVGGAGPQAGVSLVSKIYEESRSPNDQGNPRVHLISSPCDLPDRSAFLLGLSSLNPAFGFAKVLWQLAQGGATVAGIACVTAHAPPIFSHIQALLGETPPLRLLSLLEELERELRGLGYSRLGVLSTKGTYQAGLFGPAFARAIGAEVLEVVDESERESVHRAIYKIKASGHHLAEARETILSSAATLQKRGAQAVLLACTELPLAVPEEAWNGLPVVDPLRVLARALLRETQSAPAASEGQALAPLPDVSSGLPESGSLEDYSVRPDCGILTPEAAREQSHLEAYGNQSNSRDRRGIKRTDSSETKE